MTTVGIELSVVDDPALGRAVLIQWADHYLVVSPSSAKALAANLDEIADEAASRG
jgi:hypothetical protein